ncbi:MAG TPA: response regulator [Pyrinomonadaceae bacterium]
MMSQTATILVANDDDEALRRQEEALASEGFRVLTASKSDEAKEVLQNEQVDIAVLDIRLDKEDDETDTSGLDLAEKEESGVLKVLTTVWPNPEIRRRAERLKAESKIEDFVDNGRTDAILKAVWKAVAHRTQIQVGAGAEGVQEDWRVMVSRRYRARVALVLLLLALGAGVMAVITENPQWLMGTVAFAVFTVIFVGTSIE